MERRQVPKLCQGIWSDKMRMGELFLNTLKDFEVKIPEFMAL